MDDTRQRILEVAGQTFAEKGFEEATVREICQRAEANLAAVNYHFGDKAKLYVEAVKQAHCHQGGEIPEFPWTSETPPEQKLSDFIHHMMSMMLENDRPSWHLELMLREMSRPTEACTELVQSFIGPMFGTLLSIIRELLPPGTSPEAVRLHGFSIVGQCLLYRYHRPIGRLLIGEEDFRRLFQQIEQTAAHIVAFSLGGLRAAHQATAAPQGGDRA